MGSSSQNTQTTQQSQTSPWSTAMPTVNGIMDQLNPLIANSGLNSTESGAINQLTQNAQAGNPYATAIGNNATSLLNGGGAMNQAGAVNQNLANYTAQTQPLASNTNYDPTQTPGVQAALQAIQAQVANSVNSQFAGAGRDLSGANQMAYGTGIAQAEAPLLLGQYNQNVQNQQSAAQNLYNAGNTTSSALASMQNQANANTQTGTTAAGAALQAQNYGPTATLAAQQLGQSIPAQNLGLLAQIGIPIAGLGSTSSGSGTSNSTYNPSLLSQIQQGIGIGTSLFGGASGGTSGPTSVGGSPLSSAGQSNPGLFGSLYNWSDRRLKEDVEQVGTLFDGTPVYGYRYKGAPSYHIGLMAQDVEKTTPGAVIEINGFKAVDYRLATETARKMKAA